MSVGRNLLILLYDHKMTKKELADKVGCDPSLISKIISGDRKIQTELAIKIAELFNISLDELILGRSGKV